MRKTERKIIYGLPVLAASIGLGYYFNILTQTKILTITSIMILGGGGYTLYKKTKLKELLEVFNSEEFKIKNSWTEQDSREFLEEWSEENYSKDNKIKFRWDDAEFFETEEQDFKERDRVFHCFVTSLGENNKEVAVYIDALKKKHIGHVTIQNENRSRFRKDPFKHCQKVVRFRNYTKRKLQAEYSSGYRRKKNRGMPLDENLEG